MSVLTKVNNIIEHDSHLTAGQVKLMELFRTVGYIGDDWYLRVKPSDSVADMLMQDPSEPAFVLAVTLRNGIVVKVARNARVVKAASAIYQVIEE
jgi:hypothetical protein